MLNSENLTYKDILSKKYKGVEKLSKEGRSKNFNKYMKGLTMAQKRGLVERPPEPLKPEEWTEIVDKAVDRLDRSQNCAICMEPYGIRQQVVLSCSHVFHKNCIKSFEKFTKMTKKCPMCRTENYETCKFVEGTKVFI